MHGADWRFASLACRLGRFGFILVRVMKPVYFLLGWGFFGIGLVGAVLPGLPTTPFMLLALWAFSRSSERFHRWLYGHKVFGPPLRQWHTDRIIPARVKVFAIVMMLASLGWLALFAEVKLWVTLLTAVVMLSGAIFILSKPSRVPGTDQPAKPDAS